MKLHKLCLEQVLIDEFDDWTENATISPNGNCMNLFTNCTSLVELKVFESFSFYRVIFENSFPKLEHFIIEDPCRCIKNSTEGFILRHPNLKTFSLDSDEDHIPVLQVLAANGNSLQKLGFGFQYRLPSQTVEPSLEILSKLRNLKELKCFVVTNSILNIVKELPQLQNTLEVLDLSVGYGTSELIPINNSK